MMRHARTDSLVATKKEAATVVVTAAAAPEMTVGYTPFSDPSGDVDTMKIFRRIIDGKIAYPEHMSKQAKAIVKEVLQKQLNKRLGNQKGGMQVGSVGREEEDVVCRILLRRIASSLSNGESPHRMDVCRILRRIASSLSNTASHRIVWTCVA